MQLSFDQSKHVDKRSNRKNANFKKKEIVKCMIKINGIGFL